MKRHTTRFDERPEMANRQFFDCLAIAEEHHDLAAAVRRAIAAACGVKPEFIYPTDPTRRIAKELAKQRGMDWDEILVLVALEDEFGDDLPDIVDEWPTFLPWKFLWWKGGHDKFGNWLELVVQAIARKLPGNTAALVQPTSIDTPES